MDFDVLIELIILEIYDNLKWVFELGKWVDGICLKLE